MEKERRKMKKKLLVMLLGITMIFSLSLMTACGGESLMTLLQNALL